MVKSGQVCFHDQMEFQQLYLNISQMFNILRWNRIGNNRKIFVVIRISSVIAFHF